MFIIKVLNSVNFPYLRVSYNPKYPGVPVYYWTGNVNNAKKFASQQEANQMILNHKNEIAITKHYIICNYEEELKCI